ncbi:MAG TPA: hypothetical protein VNA16_00730 [Abditibacteriaceae bacterium]|nr:hypothetical protein [Abditibacteriaceae bacterium]
MTTIAVVRKNGVAAIAADSLTTSGWVKESAEYVVNHHKIMPVGNSYLGLSGPASARLILENYFGGADVEARFDSVGHIFETWRRLHSALKEAYFLRPIEDDDDDFESSRISVAIANPYGIFGVSSDRSVQEYTKFYACGSGYYFAMGAMFSVYDDPARSAEEIARLGIQAAIEFSRGSAAPILSHSITLNS